MTESRDIPIALRSAPLLIVDVEGNGQQPAEIIEMAALAVDAGRDATPASVRTWLIRPRVPIASIVTQKVHGIRNSDVAASPAFAELADEIAAVLRGRVAVAHNASVELRVITAHLPEWRPLAVVDTLRLAKHVWPGLNGYGLDALIGHAEIDDSAFSHLGHHRAAYDTWCTWQLLCRLATQADTDWPNLLRIAAIPGSAPTERGLW